MATLTGKTIANSYKDLLQVSNSNSGVDGTLRAVEDGEGTSSALQISSSGVKSTGTLIAVNNTTVESIQINGDFTMPGSLTIASGGDARFLGVIEGLSAIELLNESNPSQKWVVLADDADSQGGGAIRLKSLTTPPNGATGTVEIYSKVADDKLYYKQGTVERELLTNNSTINATTVTTNANLTGHITSVGNAATLGSFTLAQLNTALSDSTLSPSVAETNDLSANVTWANVPEANIPALPTSKITSGTFDDARIAASNVTQHAVAKTGGTFSGDLKYDHQAYFPTGAAKILHRSQFFQVFHHHIKDSNLLVNTEYAIPWAGDATSNEGTGYSSSANPRSKYRFVVPYNVMKLIKIIVKPCNNTFTSYPATMTVNRYYKQGTDADTYNPNIAGPTTYAMNTTSNAPAGVGETPALVWDIDLDNNTNMSASQSHREGWEILLTLETNTTLTNGSNYGINVTTVWSCSY